MIPMPFFSLIDAVLSLFNMGIFVMVVMSWLLSFNVINRHNQFVDGLWRAVVAITEPFLQPIRRFVPAVGGFDLSPIVLLLGVYFLREMNAWLAARIAIG